MENDVVKLPLNGKHAKKIVRHRAKKQDVTIGMVEKWKRDYGKSLQMYLW